MQTVIKIAIVSLLFQLNFLFPANGSAGLLRFDGFLLFF